MSKTDVKNMLQHNLSETSTPFWMNWQQNATIFKMRVLHAHVKIFSGLTYSVNYNQRSSFFMARNQLTTVQRYLFIYDGAPITVKWNYAAISPPILTCRELSKTLTIWVQICHFYLPHLVDILTWYQAKWGLASFLSMQKRRVLYKKVWAFKTWVERMEIFLKSLAALIKHRCTVHAWTGNSLHPSWFIVFTNSV